LNSLYDFFNKAYNENKIVQSYLIGNTRLDDIKEELFSIFNNFFFQNNIKIEENPDVYILDNKDDKVSKDDILELIQNVNKTSQFNNIKIYVIDECEKLNDFSYNALLKTLEEPATNVYAFLITRNMDSVRPTIVSRCQKIFISSEVKEENFDEQVNIIGNYLLDLLEEENLNIISKHPDLYTKITDRDMFRNILIYIQNNYMNKLNLLMDNNSNEIELLSKKILVINSNINLLNYNLNKNLAIDKFLIEMWRCNNENS